VPKVTSKLQVTVPKTIADEYRIRPGDEIFWVSGGEAIHVIPPGRKRSELSVEERLALFDAATARQRHREAQAGRRRSERGRSKGAFAREDLYEGRGRTR
jgi:AbrB family looped-hinge helix DNA binding protein